MFTFYFDGCQAELAEAAFIHDSPFGKLRVAEEKRSSHVQQFTGKTRIRL